MLAAGERVGLRRIRPADLGQIIRHAFTVSIHEPLDDLGAVTAAFEATGFWTPDAGAVAIVDLESGRLLGTCQFYRSAPCIHGYEIGYIVHDPADRGRGTASEALRLLTDHLFGARPACHRLQLLIETWNTASWKVAERCDYVREGVLRSAGFMDADEPADCFLYARTRKDWVQAQAGKDRRS